MAADTRVGDYELWARIGTGATGAVWKAYRRGTPTGVVAVKRLRAARRPSRADRRRLRYEATVLARLDHPHIVRLVDVVDDAGGVAVVMELAPGGSLDALLAERSQLSPGEVVAVAAPVADALAAAHRRGVVHGDVKAGNILFAADGRPLLADFDVSHSPWSTAGDEIVGTAGYLAPELLAGEPPDPRSDLYALGAVCYEALAGYVPLAAATPGHGAPMSDLGPLAGPVEQALARDPRRRFGSADAFARALRAAVPAGEVRLPRISGADTPVAPTTRAVAGATSDGGVASPRTTETFGPRPPRTEPRRRRARVRFIAALAAAAASLSLLVWALTGR